MDKDKCKCKFLFIYFTLVICVHNRHTHAGMVHVDTNTEFVLFNLHAKQPKYHSSYLYSPVGILSKLKGLLMLSALATIYLMLQGTGMLHKEMPPVQHANTHTRTMIHYRQAFLPSSVFSLKTQINKHKNEKVIIQHTCFQAVKRHRGVTSKKASGLFHYVCMPTHTHTLRNKHK